jgi:uncharacterized protein DUF5335
MQTIEIPRNEWIPWSSEFSASHEGWLVSLDVLNPEIGAQHEVENLPLRGVSAEAVERDGTMVVSVARKGTEHLTHIVHGVKSVQVERTDEGADVALQIESTDGTKAVLRFRTPALPETVDGIPRR